MYRKFDNTEKDIDEKIEETKEVVVINEKEQYSMEYSRKTKKNKKEKYETKSPRNKKKEKRLKNNFHKQIKEYI